MYVIAYVWPRARKEAGGSSTPRLLTDEEILGYDEDGIPSR
ncbi:hypothetical protein [Amaricoccus sp.]